MVVEYIDPKPHNLQLAKLPGLALAMLLAVFGGSYIRRRL
jgi:hypothetical protein